MSDGFDTHGTLDPRVRRQAKEIAEKLEAVLGEVYKNTEDFLPACLASASTLISLLATRAKNLDSLKDGIDAIIADAKSNLDRMSNNGELPERFNSVHNKH